MVTQNNEKTNEWNKILIKQINRSRGKWIRLDLHQFYITLNDIFWPFCFCIGDANDYSTDDANFIENQSLSSDLQWFPFMYMYTTWIMPHAHSPQKSAYGPNCTKYKLFPVLKKDPLLYYWQASDCIHSFPVITLVTITVLSQ